jgi:hypothetical protein
MKVIVYTSVIALAFALALVIDYGLYVGYMWALVPLGLPAVSFWQFVVILVIFYAVTYGFRRKSK